jgi:ABC-type sulfate transport system substrate-binding protein
MELKKLAGSICEVPLYLLEAQLNFAKAGFRPVDGETIAKEK